MKPIVKNVNDEFNRKLIEFYNKIEDYSAFEESSDHPELYKWIGKNNFENVLEVGAGKSKACQDLENCAYYAQDITNRNHEYFKKFNAPFAVSAHDFNIKFDVIFSTYVFEHVSDPERFLNEYLSLLNPGGRLLILCPRYDLAFYIPPSLRHLPKRKQLTLMSFFWLDSIFGITDNYFPINSDPACFSLKWKRDFDAVHLVSYYRLRRYLNKSSIKHRKLNLGFNFIRRRITLAIEIYK